VGSSTEIIVAISVDFLCEGTHRAARICTAKSVFGSVETADIGDVETPEEFARLSRLARSCLAPDREKFEQPNRGGA
jgi:hypothetical protein